MAALHQIVMRLTGARMLFAERSRKLAEGSRKLAEASTALAEARGSSRKVSRKVSPLMHGACYPDAWLPDNFGVSGGCGDLSDGVGDCLGWLW